MTKDCTTCNHAALPSTEQPCYDCIDNRQHPAWEPAEVVEHRPVNGTDDESCS